MSDPKDKDKSKDNKAVPASPAPPKAEEGSGRVAFDARGNPVWEWQTSTGVFGRDVSTQRLKKLEAKDLAILDSPPAGAKKKPGVTGLSLAEPRAANRATGFNPYDSSSAISPRSRVADEPRKGPKDLRKLDEWIKLQKKMKDKDKSKK